MRPLVWVIAGMGCALAAAPFAASARPQPAAAKASVSSGPLERSFLMMDMARPTFTVPVPGFQRAAPDDFAASPRFVANDHPIGEIGGLFEMPAYRGTPLDPVRLVPNAQMSDEGPMVWRTGEVLLDSSNGRASGAVDSLRMTIGAIARLPAGLVIGRDLETADLDPKAFDLFYTRGWPSALTLKAGAYDLDVSPHAGLGMSSAGGSAEAGAMVRFGSNLDTEFVQRFASGLGIHAVDGARYGDQGRWYLFAAASGRAVGLNMTRDSQTGDLRRSGWSVDPSAAIIGDSQAGLGWRKGAMQASLGYLHREVKNEFGVRGAGMGGDSMVAFSLSIHPRP
ncbi:MAG: hypothetical protein RLZZ141_204 [Pseudomonadota bacterium]|jgi:hypothetical protein